MVNIVLFPVRRAVRRGLYPLLSVAIALGLWVGAASPSPAISFLDLIFQGAQIIQLSNLSDSQEVSLGQKMNDQLVNQEFQLYTDPALNQYVTQVGRRMAASSTRPNLPYRFQIVDDSAINAFATMGGFVYVTTGLLKAADNEAQLASVLGHEIGHINARHLVEQMKETAIQRGIATAAGLDQSAVAGIGVELLLNRPNSRQAEFDADQRGLKMLTLAGYAPSAMPTFMQKLLNQGSMPSFLSTHPAVPDRIAALRQKIDPSRASMGEGLSSEPYRRQVRSLI